MALLKNNMDYLTRSLTKKAIKLIERRYEKRLVKSDKEVVFKGTSGSLFMIFICVFVISLTAYVWFLTDKSDTLISTLVVSVMSILLWIASRYLKAKIILRTDSITLIGPVYDFKEDALADFISDIRQLFVPPRTIELRWEDIDRIFDQGLIIYTKSGHRYKMNTAYFSISLIPMIGKYTQVEKCK